MAGLLREHDRKGPAIAQLASFSYVDKVVDRERKICVVAGAAGALSVKPSLFLTTTTGPYPSFGIQRVTLMQGWLG